MSLIIFTVKNKNKNKNKEQKTHLCKGNREDQIDKCHTKEKIFFKHEWWSRAVAKILIFKAETSMLW